MSDLQSTPHATEIKQHAYVRPWSTPPISNVYVRRRWRQSKSISLPVANSSSQISQEVLPADSSNKGSSNNGSSQNQLHLEEIGVPITISDPPAAENNPSWAAVPVHMPKPKTYTELLQFVEYLAARTEQASTASK